MVMGDRIRALREAKKLSQGCIFINPATDDALGCLTDTEVCQFRRFRPFINRVLTLPRLHCYCR